MKIHREQTHSDECHGFKSPVTELALAALRDERQDVESQALDPSAQQQSDDDAALERLGNDPGPGIVARVLEEQSRTGDPWDDGEGVRPSLKDDITAGKLTELCETRPIVPGEADSTDFVLPSAAEFYESQTSLVTPGGVESDESPQATICREYREIIARQRLSDARDYPLRKLLGAGGQGRVYLSERPGADDFRQPLAVKVFSPEKYPSARSYLTAMARLSQIVSQLSWPQHGNVVDIQGFEQRGQIRIMLMELVEGYDLRQLLDPKMPEVLRRNLSGEHWNEVCQIVMVPGPEGPRLQPGVAVSIIRDCLAGLDSLHSRGLVHGDIKLANIMVQRAGRAKIIDLGSAYHRKNRPRTLVYTPAYAAPETLKGKPQTRRSDLASLGYVLVELLTGQRIFAGIDNINDLIDAKCQLPRRLKDLMPSRVRDCDTLLNFCQRLIAPDPNQRWENADRAYIDWDCGAAKFLDQLVLGNLASVYEREIRLWLSGLPSRNV